MQFNPQQKQAVEHMTGPMLVLSGAGTGKTRVIVGRIEHLLANGISPQGILAITFTRKAADEMKRRLLATGAFGAEAVTVSTFHALCLRMLKQYAAGAKLPQNFTVMDEGVRARLLSGVLRDAKMDKTVSVADMASFISSCKNRLLTADAWEREALAHSGGNAQHAALVQAQANIFRAYEAKKAETGGLDFDDLLVRFYTLLYEDKSVRGACQARFTHVLIDEYQDTNVVQYRIAHMLTQFSHNLCVVGDDDQSIYAWRGAEVDNILDFPTVFKNCAVVRLEQNYRCTKSILDAANAVIRHNTRRMQKRLWTENAQGDKPRTFCAETAVSECRLVATLIKRLNEQGVPYSDMAVLYRRNSASATMEEALAAKHIPCAITGDSGIFDLYEIKQLLSRMEKDDNTSLPMRALEKHASDMGYFRKKRELEAAEAELPAWIEAVSVLFDSASEFFAVHKRASLPDFAQHIRSIAENRAEKGADAVNLLTLHSAKGLEFRVVFMIQLSDDVIPGRNEGAKEEEERRLFYVGMTRAKELLFLSVSQYTSYDARNMRKKEPSRFLREIPPTLVRTLEIAAPKPRNKTESPQKPAKTEKPPAKDTRFQAGDRVLHARYGCGIVMETTPLYTRVRFDNGEEKKFLRQFLEKQQ